MYKFNTPQPVLDGLRKGSYIPSRELLDQNIANKLKRSNHFKEGDSIFYESDVIIQLFDKPVLEVVGDVRKMISGILREHGSPVYLAAQLGYGYNYVSSKEYPNHYSPNRRLAGNDQRLYRFRTSDYAQYQGVYDSFPRVNREHPYLVSEEMHRLCNDGPSTPYIMFTPDRSGASVLEDCNKQLSVIEAVKVILDSMLACAAIHRTGEAHVDVKPDNIFVRKDHTGMLIGNLFDNEFRRPFLNDSRYMHGTPYYMPQYWGENRSRVDYRHNDIFAFGLMLFDIVLGTTEGAAFFRDFDLSSNRTNGAGEFGACLMRYAGSILSQRAAETILSMLTCSYKQDILLLDDCAKVLAQEFGLKAIDHHGSVYVGFPEEYQESSFAQYRFSGGVVAVDEKEDSE